MKKTAILFILCFSIFLYAYSALDFFPWVAAASLQKDLLCLSCHGSNGLSTNPQWPNLAGQNKKYLIKQLQDLMEGKGRTIPAMTAIIASLTQQDLDDLASYYAKMPIAQKLSPKTMEQRGQQLYTRGDANKGIIACVICHGPKAMGNAQAGFPVLLGQHAAYTVMQLQAFKKKSRNNDYQHIMQDISSKMDQSDMEAVAYFIEYLHF